MPLGLLSRDVANNDVAYEQLKKKFLFLQPIVMRYSFECIFDQTKDSIDNVYYYFDQCTDVMGTCTNKGRGIGEVIDSIACLCASQEEYDSIPGRLFIDLYLEPLLNEASHGYHQILIWNEKLMNWRRLEVAA